MKEKWGMISICIAFMLIFPSHSLGKENHTDAFKISSEDAYKMLKDGTDIILDARGEDDYNECHIKNAISLPLAKFLCNSCFHSKLNKDKRIIIYDESGEKSVVGYNILKEKGFENVYVLKGGMNAWMDAGFPISQNNITFSVMEEVPPLPDESELSPKPARGNPPSEFSWRDYEGKDWTTPARYQGNCGSCWDFAAVGALESIINIREGIANLDPDLSEQYILSCLPMSGSCRGGSPYLAFKYIKSSSADGNYHNGIIPESCFPYEANDAVPCSWKCKDWEEMLVPIADYGTWIPESSADRDRIKTEIMEEGPLVTYMDATDDFMQWGIYHHDPSDYYPYPGRAGNINHCVVLVGWKDDPSITNGGYWIVKNSWGAGWGYEGFFNIEYGSLHIDDYAITWVDYDPSDFDWPPVADAGGPYYAHVGEEIIFNGESCDAEGSITYTWDFGDGNTSHEKNPSHAYSKKGMYTVKLTVRDEEGKESTDEASVFIDVWNEGEKWTYDMDKIEINMEDDWGSISFDGTLNDLSLEVGGTDGAYTLNFKGTIKGDFTASLTQPPLDISGKFLLTRANGEIKCKKSNFGIENIDVNLRGIVAARIDPIPIPLPIPFTASITLTFDPAFAPVDFPIKVGKEWNIPPSHVSMDASASLLFGIIRKSFQNELSLGAITTACNGRKNVTVEAGTYDAYEISSMDIVDFYYSPEVSNVIELSAEYEDMFSIHGELKSTNYK